MSTYEQERERQRQLDLMKVAVGGDDFDDEGNDEDGLTRRGGKRSNSNNPSHVAMESARRFLWDEEEEEVDIPLGGPSHNISLTGTQTLFTSKDYNAGRQPGTYGGVKENTGRSSFMGGMFGGEPSPVITSTTNLRSRDAEYRKPRQSKSGCGKCMFYLIATIIFVAAIIGLVSLTSGGEEAIGEEIEKIENIEQEMTRGGDSNNAEPSGDTRMDRISSILSLQSSIDMEDKESAQYKAFDWIVNTDPLQLNAVSEDLLERYTLSVFFFSTGGEVDDSGAPTVSWNRSTNWMTGTSVCTWYGIECVTGSSDTEGKINALMMGSNKISGVLPPELKSLKLLQKLDLSRNKLTGSIPVELTYASNLISVDLRHNNLSGSIPSEIGEMKLLRDLNLGSNSLTGEIPTTINQATDLRAFSAEKNSLVGSIPTLDGLDYLLTLYLDHNGLVGDIPLSLYTLTSLFDVRLDHNQLTGAISPELSNLSNLDYLYLTGNEFTGELPDVFDKLSGLAEFYAGKNSFSGVLPESMKSLTLLKLLNMEKAGFSGPLNPEFSAMTSLEELVLHENQLSGTIDSDIFAGMTKLKILMLYKNSFSGPIPDSLSSCEGLEQVFLEENGFSGEVPGALGSLQNLERLSVHSNEIGGSMPDSICTLADGSLSFLSADCAGEEKVSCDCCHKCYE